MEPENGELGFVRPQIEWMVADRRDHWFSDREQAQYNTLIKRERGLLPRQGSVR